MLILEYKIKAKPEQYAAIDEAIRTAQFVRNKALRLWMDTPKMSKYDLNKYCRTLAKEYKFVDELNSTARQASAERAWSAIARFYDNCKKKVKGKKGYPRFKKNARSVEYKHSGWKLDTTTKKHITFTDKKGIGRVKLVGSRDIYFYNSDDIKRVRLVRRADGYYAQFSISVDVRVETEPTGKAVGLDVGLKYFLADSNGHTEANPQFYRNSEKRIAKLNRRISRKFNKGSKQSSNYQKARIYSAKLHLRISRQREEHSKRLARCVCTSNDVIVYEDLQVKNLVKNHCLSKSINDAGWYQFRKWVEYFGLKFGKITIAVPPHFTSQDCSNCGTRVPKSLSTRTHQCPHCGYCEDRDINSAKLILQKGLSTVGHTGTRALSCQNAWGDESSTFSGEILLEQDLSVNQESPD